MRILPLLLVLALAAGACSQLNVVHLERRPWTLEKPQEQDMGFMRFEYEVLPMKDHFGVRGKAYLKEGTIPSWAEWIDDLWLAAYLSDDSGDVLAQNIRVFVPRPVDHAQGVDFEFILKPEYLKSGPLYISFGYRMVLTEDKLGTGGHMPFFASEGALFK